MPLPSLDLMQLLRTLGTAGSGGWGLVALGLPPPPLLKADQGSRFLKSRNADDWTLAPSPACTASILCTWDLGTAHPSVLTSVPLFFPAPRSALGCLLPLLTPAHPSKTHLLPVAAPTFLPWNSVHPNSALSTCFLGLKTSIAKCIEFLKGVG